MPTLLLKGGRIYVAFREEDLDLVEEGWEPLAKFKSPVHALRVAVFLADRFEYVVEWG
ncbi:MAG: hypothetical protein QXI84_07595 [Thermofilaceae archaeon]